MSQRILLKGSFTIEATFIFPLVVSVVLFIIYSAFYLHNEAVIQGVAYEIAIYGTMLDKSDKSVMQEKMEKKYKDAIDGRLISMDEPKLNIECEGKTIKVNICGRMDTVIFGISDNYNDRLISAERIVKYSNPIDKIWVLKLIENLK